MLHVQNYIFLRHLACSKRFSDLQVVHKGSRAHTAFRLMCTRVFFSQAWSIRSVTLTTHVYLAPRLRMSGVLLLLPPHIPSRRRQGQIYLHHLTCSKLINQCRHFIRSVFNTTHFSKNSVVTTNRNSETQTRDQPSFLSCKC